jgi:6-phosphogluconolactonase/glucosamine-6-phosphate isomerase/deaminase
VRQKVSIEGRPIVKSGVHLLNNAACVLVLVSGKAKARTLQAVFQGTDTAARYPAQLLRPSDGELIWIVDRDAAQLLTDKISAGEN